jgi:hypothetical protein
VTTSYSLPLFAGGAHRTSPRIPDGSQWNGDFDPSRDRFFVPYCSDPNAACNGPFPYQGTSTIHSRGIWGRNMTCYNPKVRQFPNYNENLSVARSFPIHESAAGVPGRRLQRIQPSSVWHWRNGLQGNTFGN